VGLADTHIFGRLKAATQPDHASLENKLALTNAPSVAHVTRVLQTFYGFYAVWEPTLEPWMKQLFGALASSRAKCVHLVADLRFSGIDPARLPLCPFVPQYDSLASALGGLYVMEGATLGGQVIARHFSSQFFSGYGPETGPMWREFQSTVRNNILSDQDVEAAVVSACQTFGAFHRWVEECGF